METEEAKVKGMSEIRFSRIIFFLRLAGIPIKMEKMPTLYALYMITGIICTHSTLISMFVETYIHRHDLARVMTNLRILTGMTTLVWVYFSCR